MAEEVSIVRSIAEDPEDPLRYYAIQTLATPSFAQQLVEAGALIEIGQDLSRSFSVALPDPGEFSNQQNDQMFTLQTAARSIPEAAALAAEVIAANPESLLPAVPALLRLIGVAGPGAGRNVATLFVELSRGVGSILETEPDTAESRESGETGHA